MSLHVIINRNTYLVTSLYKLYTKFKVAINILYLVKNHCHDFTSVIIREYKNS